jgi:hypothetical protein
MCHLQTSQRQTIRWATDYARCSLSNAGQSEAEGPYRVVTKSYTFWYIPLKVNRCFGGNCHLHFQGWRVGEAKCRAIAQAVSRRLPTAAAWARSQVKSCGICGERSGAGVGFLRVLRFPLPILIPPTAPYTSSGAGTIGQLVADVPNGLCLTPPQETKKKSKKPALSRQQA